MTQDTIDLPQAQDSTAARHPSLAPRPAAPQSTGKPPAARPGFTSNGAWNLALFAGLAAVFAYLVGRNLGLHPNVFADEWFYSKMSRLMPLKDAMVPSYLYLWLFRATNACGAGFYDCAKAANSLLFVAAAPFIYLVAREVAGKALSAALALAATLAPLNIYTSFFMPESMYYLGFSVLAWVVLTRDNWRWDAQALAAGSVLGLMSLVKVHALFLLPALCLFLLYAHWVRGGAWPGRSLGAAAVAVATTLAIKFGLGYALAGKAGLSVFGPFYSSSAGASHPLPALLSNASVSGLGHLMGLALLLPLPVALLAQLVLRPPRRASAGKPELLKLFGFLMLGSALGVTVLYTATLAQPGVTSEGLRLHLRYYTFAFPLLWIAAAAAGTGADHGKRGARWAIALPLCALIVLAVLKLRAYAINPIDAPELYPLNRTGVLHAIAGIDIAVLVLWALRPAQGVRAYLYAALPALLACGLAATAHFLHGLAPDTPEDRAAALVRRLVPPAERSQVIVAGSNPQLIMHTQFHIDDKDSELLELPADAPIEPYQLPVRNKWLVVLGHHPLPDGVKPVEPGDGFALVHVASDDRRVGSAALYQPFGEGLIASAEGLSHAEPPWGRWSDAGKVVLHFSAPLPRHLSVIIKAQAYGVNTTLPFTMTVGGQSRSFRLGAAPGDVRLTFETDGDTRTLTIDVPQPTAPSELGQSNDTRKLGIGLCEIEIDARDEALAAN